MTSQVPIYARIKIRFCRSNALEIILIFFFSPPPPPPPPSIQFVWICVTSAVQWRSSLDIMSSNHLFYFRFPLIQNLLCSLTDFNWPSGFMCNFHDASWTNICFSIFFHRCSQSNHVRLCFPDEAPNLLNIFSLEVHHARYNYFLTYWSYYYTLNCIIKTV
jgi:hypothetical protein